MPAFLVLGLAWFVGGALFEKTLAMRRIQPLPGPGPAALVKASLARKPVTMVAEFEPKSALLLGGSPVVVHPRSMATAHRTANDLPGQLDRRR